MSARVSKPSAPKRRHESARHAAKRTRKRLQRKVRADGCSIGCEGVSVPSSRRASALHHVYFRWPKRPKANLAGCGVAGVLVSQPRVAGAVSADGRSRRGNRAARSGVARAPGEVHLRPGSRCWVMGPRAARHRYGPRLQRFEAWRRRRPVAANGHAERVQPYIAGPTGRMHRRPAKVGYETCFRGVRARSRPPSRRLRGREARTPCERSRPRQHTQAKLWDAL